jgi:hypothetical protein
VLGVGLLVGVTALGSVDEGCPDVGSLDVGSGSGDAASSELDGCLGLGVSPVPSSVVASLGSGATGSSLLPASTAFSDSDAVASVVATFPAQPSDAPATLSPKTQLVHFMAST